MVRNKTTNTKLLRSFFKTHVKRGQSNQFDLLNKINLNEFSFSLKTGNNSNIKTNQTCS